MKIKYRVFKHTLNYEKYLGYTDFDKLDTALEFIKAYLENKYCIDVKLMVTYDET